MPRGRRKKRRMLSEIIDTAKLIELVKGQEILYNYNYSKLRSSEKVAAWKHIADELGCEVKLVRLKWSYVRDQYTKFLKHAAKRKKAKKECTVWKYAPALEFVKPYITKAVIGEVADSTDDELSEKRVPSVPKLKTKKQPPAKIDKDDLSDDEEISDDDLDEDELDESLDGQDKQPTSNTSNPNQNATSSTISTTKGFQLDANDFIFLGYSRTIKTFPLIQQSLTKFRIAELIMKMETESNSEANI